MWNVDDTWTMVRTYFGNGIWLPFFLLSLLVIYLSIDEEKRRVMIAVVACFLVAISKPMIRLVGRFESIAVFYRMLWIVPVSMICGIAFLLVVSKIHESIKKLCVVLGVFVAIILTNNSMPLIHFLETPIRPAMVSKDAEEIVLWLEEQYGDDVIQVVIDAPSALASEVRLLSGRVHIVDVCDLEQQAPDVDGIMKKTCDASSLYVVDSNTKKSRAAYEEKGHTPVFSTERFLAYECSTYTSNRNCNKQNFVLALD